MRRVLVRISLSSAIILIVALLVVPTAFAKKNVIMKAFTCSLMAVDSGLAEDVQSTSSHAVNSSSNASKITCHFKYSGEGLPKRAVRLRGFPCGTFAGMTNNSMMVITPGGNIVLKCAARNANQTSQSQARASILAESGVGSSHNKLVTGANP